MNHINYLSIFKIYHKNKSFFYVTILQRREPSELMESGPGGGGGGVHENPTNADILHLDPEEADRLAGSIMNDFSRELVMVNYKFYITYDSPGPHDINVYKF